MPWLLSDQKETSLRGSRGGCSRQRQQEVQRFEGSEERALCKEVAASKLETGARWS